MTKQHPTPHETSAAAESRWAELCYELGWNQASQIIHLEGFLRNEGLFQKFISYAECAANEELAATLDLAGEPT